MVIEQSSNKSLPNQLEAQQDGEYSQSCTTWLSPGMFLWRGRLYMQTDGKLIIHMLDGSLGVVIMPAQQWVEHGNQGLILTTISQSHKHDTGGAIDLSKTDMLLTN